MRSYSQMIEGNSNPFIDDVFLHRPEMLPGAPSIHHLAFNTIIDSVESLVAPNDLSGPADTVGRTILITAPRAGYGKTHLVERLKRHLQPSASILNLDFAPSKPISWPVALSSINRQFLHSPGHHSDHGTLYGESGHYLLSQIILSHRQSGYIQTGQCPASDHELKGEFHHLFQAGSELTNWITSHSHDLTTRIDQSFLQALGLSSTELGFWSRLIIDFTQRGESALEPLRGLSAGEARERFLQWMRISTFYRPTLLVTDGLDGFFDSDTVGMEITEIVTSIRASVPRSVTLLCVNEDVWKTVFEKRLPSAWLDRLTGDLERLRPLSQEEAAALIQTRLKKRTPISETQATRFVDALKNRNRWDAPEAALYPREVIRQARRLWNKDATRFLVEKGGNSIEEEAAQEPIENITDKVDFFEALAEDRPLPAASTEHLGDRPSSPTSPELLPPAEESLDEAPVHTQPNLDPRPGLVGIESIIEDIRGTGDTVVSETIEEPTDSFARPPAALQEDDGNSFIKAGFLKIKNGFKNHGATPALESPSVFENPGFSSAPPSAAPLTDIPMPAGPSAPHQAPVVAAASFHEIAPTLPPDWLTLLKAKESELQQRPSTHLDLERIELFIRQIGVNHPGLIQSEERFPSSRTVCVRWKVRGNSILIGFESPKNVYFWNNLLQQSLASNQKEKITAFSHATEPFDPRLFSSFGFSPAVTKGRIDVIEMNDRELNMIYAAHSIIERAKQVDDEKSAQQTAIRYLDPLWRRISKFD